MASKPIPCNLKWCQHRFDTEKEMRRHKHTDPEHFYCKKCDVDCEDWEDLTRHKVDRMAPFVEGNVKLREGEMPAHIVCEFCGEDFKSFGGRKRHRAQMHPAAQEVRCPGCTTIFCRASDMVGHLEKGQCDAISKRDFFLSMQQKFINSQIMKAPDKVGKSLEIKTLNSGKIPTITAGGEADTQDQDIDTVGYFHQGSGGAILDLPDRETGGYKALEPEVDLLLSHEGGEMRPCHSSNATPRQTASTTSQLDASPHRFSISSSTRRTSSTLLDRDDETASHSSTCLSDTVRSPAWSGNSAKTLFPHIKTSPQPGDWDAVQQAREEIAQVDDKSNILKAPWWDPISPEYNVHRFFNPFINRYCCPFPDCYTEDPRPMSITYLTTADVEDHILAVHLRRIFSCTVCFKRFDSCAALIGHAESTRKCSVRESTGFKQLIEDISGGYLKAKYVGEKKIYRPENSLVKKGQPMGGVMSTQYISKKPMSSD